MTDICPILFLGRESAPRHPSVLSKVGIKFVLCTLDASFNAEEPKEVDYSEVLKINQSSTHANIRTARISRLKLAGDDVAVRADINQVINASMLLLKLFWSILKTALSVNASLSYLLRGQLR